jgi:hypothetical protein
MNAPLDLRVKRPEVPVNLAELEGIRDLNHACERCAAVTGSQDKSIAMDMNIDPPTWARIKQGEAGIKGDFLDRLMDACGNELPLLWLLWKRGYDPASIRKRESELERQLREEREARAELEKKLAHITEFVREARS